MKRLLFILLTSCAAPPPEPPKAVTIEDFTVQIAQRKDDASLYIARGTLYVRARRLAEADADFTEAIRLAPRNFEPYLRRSAIRQGADAARDRAEARLLGSPFADGFYNDGVRAYTQGQIEEAERNFRFAIDLQPFHSLAHVAMGRLYLERRQFELAAEEFDQAIPIGSENAELFFYRGNARIAAGRGEEAISDFAKAVELDPAEPTYYTARGLALQRVRGDFTGARSNYDEAIRIDPKCHAAWVARGVMSHELKDLAAAERDLRTAGTIRASPEGCLALGRVLHDRGDYDKALALYRGAIDLYKDTPFADPLRQEEERTRRAKEKR